MKKFIILLCFPFVFCTGCDNINLDTLYTSQPQQAENNLTIEETLDSRLENTPTPQAKISSDFKDAPNAQMITEETGKKITAVLLQDTLTYTISTEDYFSVCLEEDAEKAYRWLLVGDNELFELVEEAHINSYRAFIFKPLGKGETSILFELTQESTVIDTLSYQIILS